MSNEDELDDGLRRLFADDRLAIRPKPDAHQLIVAGAKRARKRRDIALIGGGSLTAVLVIVGGMLLASPRFDGDQQVAGPRLTTSEASSESAPTSKPSTKEAAQPPPSAGAPSPRITPTRTKASPTGRDTKEPVESLVPETLETPFAASSVLERDGYGELKLGMSFDEVKQTGKLADPDAEAPPAERCQAYQLVAEEQDSVREITVSDQVGLAVISASGARTPEDIGIGSTREEIESAYPNHTTDESGYFVPTGAGAVYRLVIAEDSTAEALLLIREEQDCGSF